MVVRFRQMTLGIFVVGALVSLPLLTVWKHACMRTLSLEHTKLSDSLTTARREVERLRLEVERLSATERIEEIARTARGLEYPTSDRICLVGKSASLAMPSASWEFFSIVKKSFSRNKG